MLSLAANLFSHPMASEVRGLDLDGVTAQKPKKRKEKWGRMNGAARRAWKEYLLSHYLTAEPLRKIKPSDIIITARKNTPNEVRTTTEWFRVTFGFVPQIFFLDTSRSIANVINFKSSVIKSAGITKYYEDNEKVLRGIHRECPDVSLVFVDPDGNEHKFPRDPKRS